MPDYIYQALNEDDDSVSGQITAAHAAEAVALLEARGLAVQMIRQVTAPGEVDPQTRDEPILLAEPGGESDDELLNRRVEQMISQRKTLAPALAAFAQEMPAGRARRSLTLLAGHLDSGISADELCRSPAMTAAAMPLLRGMSAVDSNDYLHSLFQDAARDNAIRTQRIRALAYPLMVIVLAAVVLILISVFLIPSFADIFNDFELELPTLTKVLVNFSLELRRNPVAMIFAPALVLTLGYGVVYLVWSGGALNLLTTTFAKGSSRQVMAMANFERRLANALQAGLSPAGALRAASRIESRSWVGREARKLASEIDVTGDPPRLSKLPPSLRYAFRAGAGDTPNVALIQALADMYIERVHSRFDWSTGFVPQFAVLMVGLVVGFVVLALFLPLVMLLRGLTG